MNSIPVWLPGCGPATSKRPLASNKQPLLPPDAMYRYTVRCQFTGDDPEVARRWLCWLTETHIADVMQAGASGAEIVQMGEQSGAWEIRYRFADREAFQRYLEQHADDLRADGASRFPVESGLHYSRTHGQVVYRA